MEERRYIALAFLASALGGGELYKILSGARSRSGRCNEEKNSCPSQESNSRFLCRSAHSPPLYRLSYRGSLYAECCRYSRCSDSWPAVMAVEPKTRAATVSLHCNRSSAFLEDLWCHDVHILFLYNSPPSSEVDRTTHDGGICEILGS